MFAIPTVNKCLYKFSPCCRERIKGAGNLIPRLISKRGSTQNEVISLTSGSNKRAQTLRTQLEDHPESGKKPIWD